VYDVTTTNDDGVDSADAADIGLLQYRRLRDRILAGELAPGAVIIEASVSAEAGISRTPIREALARLEVDRLVERVGRSMRVRRRSVEEIVELHEVRGALETEVARLAAIRRTTVDVARFRFVADLAREAGGDPAATARAHEAWHAQLRITARNRELSGLLERYDGLLGRRDLPGEAPAPDLDAVTDVHERIAAAIREERTDEVEALMRRHASSMSEAHIEALVRSGA
jgi:DNA-binding GntR family transcriptional regulator